MQILGIAQLLVMAVAAPQDEPGVSIVVPKVTLADQPRPNLAVRIDGAILAGARVLFAPGVTEEGNEALLTFLADAASRLPKEHRAELGVMIPSLALMVRSDENAPFSSVSRIVQAASQRGIAITRMEFPVRRADGSGEQDVVEYESPEAILQNAWFERELPEVLVARVRVLEAGRRMQAGGAAPWEGTPGTRFELAADRRIEFSFGSFVTDDYERARSRLETLSARHPDVEILRLSAGEGVTFGEVLRFYQDARETFLVDLSLGSD